MARKPKKGATGRPTTKKRAQRRQPRSLAALMKAGPLPVPPRSPARRVEIHLNEFPDGSFPGVDPGAFTECRVFRLTCDVYLQSIEHAGFNSSPTEPLSVSLELVGCGDPTLEEVTSPKRAKKGR